MKKNVFLLTIVLLLGAGTIRAAEQPIRLVNTGPMHVADNGATTLYVPHSVQMLDVSSSTSNVEISQLGITSIGGSFYQDSKSNVFEVDANGWGTSIDGSIVFSGNTGAARSISTYDPDDMATFEKSAHYVAFPNLVIATNDQINVPGRMGIDATTIKYESAETGTIHLKSEVYTDKVYDASLRISGAGTSEDLVDAGSVVVEKELSLYRTGTGLLFPFAAPYTNLRSGYFAGNFVRRMLEDPATGHVRYVLGNQDSNGDDIIDAAQYVANALEEFNEGKAYLIKARGTSFDYSELDLVETDGTGIYDKGLFVFDGNPYNMPSRTTTKQLFAGDDLFNKSLSGETFTNTVNWIIGNSYTSAISVEALYNAMRGTGLKLSPIIYYYSPGSASYTPYNLLTGSPSFTELTDIPAMTTLMIRASKGEVQTGDLTISSDMQTHGKMSANFLRSERQYDNELVFRVSPDDNKNVYDQALIALRPTASGSIEKISSPDSDNFRLYADDYMSISIQELGTKSVPLGFVASDQVENYSLSVSRVESMTTEGVWLEDRKTGEWIDLTLETEYNFESNTGDNASRFVVHFAPRAANGLELFKQSPLSVYSTGGEIIISGLVSADVDAPVVISDIQGRTLINDRISIYPAQKWQAAFNAGVYMVRIGGERNETVKVLVK